MVYTTLEKINIAKISQYLVSADLIKSGLWGGGQDLAFARKLYVIRKSVEDVYNLDSSDSTLYATSTYLYALCAAYNTQAEYILNSGTGGVVPPILPASANTQPLEFIVDGSTQIPTGGNIFLFNTSPYDYRGFNLIFNRGNQPQGQINNGSSYFSYNKTTGAFQCFGNAVQGEDFQFYPTI